jgi:flagellar hook-basal body complex protein FliE
VTAIAPLTSTPIAFSEMTRPLGGVDGASPVSPEVGASPTAGTSGADSLGALFTDALDQANRADLAATKKVDALASGAADDLHGTMISMKEADISIRLVGTVRNKILDAFQELWRTSV